VLAAGLVSALGLRAEEAVLASGKAVQGRLKRQSGRLVFIGSAPQRYFRLEQVAQVRMAPVKVMPLRAATVFRLLLTDERRLTGELLSMDRDQVRFRPAWGGPLTVPRAAVVGITQVPGLLSFWDEDFEDGLAAWKVTGEAKLSGRQYFSGKQSLMLEAPRQAAEFTLAGQLQAGQVGVNFYDGTNTGGSRWLLEAEFQTAQGPRVVRAVVADDGGNYTAEVPGSDQKPFPVARSAGWHRLTVEFGPQRLVVTVDDDLLFVSRRRGPGGPLGKFRLMCTAGKGKHRGAVFFDDVGLARTVAALDYTPADPDQDEVWLAGGDQVLGSIRRADRRRIDQVARFGARPWNWGQVRGIFLRRQSSAPWTTQGEHVTVWLRTGAGPQPDRLAGLVRALDDRRLVLHAPDLGEVAIDRDRLQRVRWEFHGRRIVLDDAPHHLGPKGRPAAELKPARAEGTKLRWRFRLKAVPHEARLRVEVVRLKGMADDIGKLLTRGELRTEVVVNDKVVDYLNRQVQHSEREPRWLTMALPERSLRAGENTLLIRLKPEKGTNHYESCGLTGVIVDIPQ
jgi:hypothetical protein